MKNSLLLLGTTTALLVSMSVFAQQKEGKVLYERVSQVQINIAGMPGLEQQLPKTRTDRFELSFANNQSLWKQAEQETDQNDNLSSGGLQINLVGAGNDDVLFTDLDKKTRVEKRDFMDKQFIVDDSIRSLKWKLGDETRTILNHLCRKATAFNISKRTMMTNENGNMERKEIDDTANITAWFAADIPVSAGPGEYQGQLPGLILEMDVNNGRQSYKAISLETKPDIAAIKAPTGKKHYTREEYTRERDKMMDEMQRNNGGGQRIFRSN
jgi:GLPGLI family protein